MSITLKRGAHSTPAVGKRAVKQQAGDKPTAKQQLAAIGKHAISVDLVHRLLRQHAAGLIRWCSRCRLQGQTPAATSFARRASVPNLDRRHSRNAQVMAAHENPRTTKLHDRTGDEITLDEVERITI
jgi:hypothetical protein